MAPKLAGQTLRVKHKSKLIQGLHLSHPFVSFHLELKWPKLVSSCLFLFLGRNRRCASNNLRVRVGRFSWDQNIGSVWLDANYVQQGHVNLAWSNKNCVICLEVHLGRVKTNLTGHSFIVDALLLLWNSVIFFKTRLSFLGAFVSPFSIVWPSVGLSSLKKGSLISFNRLKLGQKPPYSLRVITDKGILFLECY